MYLPVLQDFALQIPTTSIASNSNSAPAVQYSHCALLGPSMPLCRGSARATGQTEGPWAHLLYLAHFRKSSPVSSTVVQC